MAMDKELQLIYEYKNAPESLKKAADAHRANSNALAKKKAQAFALQTEIDQLNMAYIETEKAFKSELKAWTPKGE